MSELIPLTKLQGEIMQEFYAIKPTKVIFPKKERNELWKKAIARTNDFNLDSLKSICPALFHQIEKSYLSGKNIQPAVFSECVYAQTIANMFKLDVFVNCFLNNDYIPKPVLNLIKSYNLVPRYVYSTKDKRRMLIQAGGCDGIDSALITVIDLVIYTIEFKEPGAKTSEPDLPKYKEDGLLITDDEKWLSKNGQFKYMLEEQKGLNFFDVMGHNISNFSKNSIMYAVSNNYINKLLNVICTEDVDGYLVMMPANQVQLWAEIEGEIRPSGRNHYDVWTPYALKQFIKKMGGRINGSSVEIKKNKLEIRKERGGAGKISGYKITPLFFIYIRDCKEKIDEIIFNIDDVQQLNPTIAGKVFFRKLKHRNVKDFYKL